MEKAKSSLATIIIEVIVGVSVPIIIYFLSTLAIDAKVELISPTGQVTPKFSVVWTPPKQECNIQVYQLGKMVWGQEKNAPWYQSGQAVIELPPSRHEYLITLTDHSQRIIKNIFQVIAPDKTNSTSTPAVNISQGVKPLPVNISQGVKPLPVKPKPTQPENKPVVIPKPTQPPPAKPTKPEDKPVTAPKPSRPTKPEAKQQQRILVNARIKGQRKGRLLSVYKPMVILETGQGQKIYIGSATPVKPGSYKLVIAAPDYQDKIIASYIIPHAKEGRFTIREVLIGKD